MKINNRYERLPFEEDNMEPPQVVVKFRDEIQLPYEDNIEKELDKDGAWSRLKERFPNISIRRLFTSVEPKRIQELVAEAEKQNRDYKAPNFLTYFVVEYKDGKDPVALASALSEWDIVKETYVAPKPAPAPAADAILNFQNYLNPSKAGINAAYGWAIVGGYGDSIRLIDMEKGWDAHVGLPFPFNNNTDLNTALIPGSDNHAERDHGTKVLGVILAQNSGTHCKCGTGTSCKCGGIAKNAITNLVSEWRTGSGRTDKADAIMAVINFLALLPDTDGSVLLIELQSDLSVNDPDPLAPAAFSPVPGCGPIEVYRAESDAIQLATTRRIVVIEAAGNAHISAPGSFDPPVNLDNLQRIPLGSPGLNILNPSSPAFRDSGAIIVGAATWEIEHQPTKRPALVSSMTSSAGDGTAGIPTNYGNRVDCYAWGEYVTTTNTGNIYTALFDGTSSASAIIAGVALVVQGIAKARHLGDNPNGTYKPATLRSILSDSTYGTLSNNPIGDLIGVMPDLEKIIDKKMGLGPDAYLRDFLGDVGDPHIGPISASPDIIVRNIQVTAYDSTFSANWNNDGLGDEIVKDGSSKYIYVRVKNRGVAPAKDVQVTVYWSEVSTLPTPSMWMGNKIGTAIIPIIQGGMIKVTEIIWTNSTIPSTGHYCFVGIIGTTKDPAPNPLTITDWPSYNSFIRNNNNVTWCNFNVKTLSAVSMSSGAAGGPDEPGPAGGGEGNNEYANRILLPFLVTGAQFEDLPMQLEVNAQLPERAQLWLEGSESFLTALSEGRSIGLEDTKEKGIKRITVNPRGSDLFRIMPFPRDLRERMRLIANIPAELRQQPDELFVRQLHKNEEIGRITWRLVPQMKKDEELIS